MESIYCHICRKEFLIINRGLFRTDYCKIWRKPKLEDIVLICQKCNIEYNQSSHFVGMRLDRNWDWFEMEGTVLIDVSQKRILSFIKGTKKEK